MSREYHRKMSLMCSCGQSIYIYSRGRKNGYTKKRITPDIFGRSFKQDCMSTRLRISLNVSLCHKTNQVTTSWPMYWMEWHFLTGWIKSGSKLDPNWIQTGSQLDPNNWIQTTGSQLDPNWIPTGSNLAPIWIEIESRVDHNRNRPGTELDMVWLWFNMASKKIISFYLNGKCHHNQFIESLLSIDVVFIFTDVRDGKNSSISKSKSSADHGNNCGPNVYIQ